MEYTLEDYKASMSRRSNEELEYDAFFRQGYFFGAEELFDEIFPLLNEKSGAVVEKANAFVERQKAMFEACEAELKRRKEEAA